MDDRIIIISEHHGIDEPSLLRLELKLQDYKEALQTEREEYKMLKSYVEELERAIEKMEDILGKAHSFAIQHVGLLEK